jgi:transposase
MEKRKFTNEFKQEAVKLVLEQGLSVSVAAQDLGLNSTTLHGWLKKAREGVLDPSSPKSQELEELKQLRKEVRELRMEREILKKATAFFAKLEK